MKAIQAKGARRISVVSWDSEDLARGVARVLAAGFSRQLEKKCAAVFFEGLRPRVEEQDGYAVLTLPESDAGAAPQGDFALQFIASTLSPGMKLVASAEAHLFVLPKEGLPRHVVQELDAFSSGAKPRWLGVIEIEQGGAHE